MGQDHEDHCDDEHMTLDEVNLRLASLKADMERLEQEKFENFGPYPDVEWNSRGMTKVNQDLLVWGGPHEDSALNQMKGALALPMRVGHAAVMPDGHMGYGLPVGGVLAIDSNYVIPYAVGVDIGCFTADTKVPTLDGNDYTMEELVSGAAGETFYVWSCTEDGRIVAAEATAMKTRTDAALVEVTLDNGEVITCTPDHEFMLRDGTYREAQNLHPDDSLMPYYSIRNKDGYNHKVVSVHHIDRTEDVYCLNVPKYHNFALSAGVFVHNCGMMAMQTNIRGREVTLDDGTILPAEIDAHKLARHVFRAIPVGHRGYNTPYHGVPNVPTLTPQHDIVSQFAQRAALQCGTVGGGNHFIEFQTDDDGYLWVMIHSGSRNLGKQICDHFTPLAEASAFGHPKGLAWLRLDTDEGQNYWKQMNYCIAYAHASRERMMQIVEDNIRYQVPTFDDENIGLRFQTCHNHARVETQFGREVMVHRKGAVSTRNHPDGTPALLTIPGSMGSASYICRGTAGQSSLFSCSHGAGRPRSRTASRNMLSKEEYKQQVEDAGILVMSPKKSDTRDEWVHAYKDIDAVIEAQSDLVDVLFRLTPMATVKG